MPISTATSPASRSRRKRSSATSSARAGDGEFQVPPLADQRLRHLLGAGITGLAGAEEVVLVEGHAVDMELRPQMPSVGHDTVHAAGTPAGLRGSQETDARAESAAKVCSFATTPRAPLRGAPAAGSVSRAGQGRASRSLVGGASGFIRISPSCFQAIPGMLSKPPPSRAATTSRMGRSPSPVQRQVDFPQREQAGSGQARQLPAQDDRTSGTACSTRRKPARPAAWSERSPAPPGAVATPRPGPGRAPAVSPSAMASTIPAWRPAERRLAAR